MAKTKNGRLFSVIWILMGITIFSMLTASLTNIITNSDYQTSTEMLGKKVVITFDSLLRCLFEGMIAVINHYKV